MIVVDTTVLSNLARVQRLDLLQELFGEILIPLPAYEEILRGLEAHYKFLQAVEEILEEDWVTLGSLEPEERKLFKELLEHVDPGEAAGIAIAKRRGLLFLSDDRVARRTALGQKVSISGTLGVLKLAVEEGKLTHEEADKILQEMIASGYHAPIRSIQELWEESREGDGTL